MPLAAASAPNEPRTAHLPLVGPHQLVRHDAKPGQAVPLVGDRDRISNDTETFTRQRSMAMKIVVIGGSGLIGKKIDRNTKQRVIS